MVGTFVIEPSIADCPSDEFLNKTSGSCQTCTVCTGGLVVGTPCQPDGDTVCVCPTRQYRVSSSTLCENCTDCAPGTRNLVTNCADDVRCVGLSSNNCLLSLEFFNSSSNSCVPCTQCSADQIMTRQCSTSADTVCEWRCPFPEFQFYKLNMCFLNCDKCPSGKCSMERPDSCLCNSNCYAPTDRFCQNNLCSGTSPPTTTGSVVGTSSVGPREQDVLPFWGIALIVASIVASMVLFSLCVVLLCCFGRSLGREGKRPDSSSSESGLFSSELLNSPVFKGRAETTPIPLLSSIDIFQKADHVKGDLLHSSGHVLLNLGNGSTSVALTTKTGTRLKTQPNGSSTFGTAV